MRAGVLMLAPIVDGVAAAAALVFPDGVRPQPALRDRVARNCRRIT